MFNRGGFAGQRPMGHSPMNQSGMSRPGMNLSGMNMSAMNLSGMGMTPMNQSNMNLSGMNQQRMGLPGMMLPNMGLSGMNQPNMNLNRMSQGLNQGMSQGLNQGMSQGLNQGMSKGLNPGMSKGLNPGMSKGLNQGMSQGLNQGMSQGLNQGMSQGLNQGMSKGLNQGMSKGLNQGMSKGLNQGMSQGLNRGMSQGLNQGMNLGMSQGMNLGMSQGMKQGMTQGMTQGMSQGGGMGFLPDMKSPSFGMRPMDNTGTFGGNADQMGMKGMQMRPPLHAPSVRLMGTQVVPQRFSNPNVPMHQGQPRKPMQPQIQEIPSIVNRVLTHSSDRLMPKPKTPLQEPASLMKEKQWDNLNIFGNAGQEMGMKSMQSGPSRDQGPKPQNRYTNESAASILQSFGLSNEDLEELSRYPDNLLTPSNMPSILRDIRSRKMNRTTPVPDQAAGRRSGGEAIPSKVIDYGHTSKYKFDEAITPAQPTEPPRTEQKPPPVPKETAAQSNTKPNTTPQKGMDNKIPTISGSRKPAWQNSKPVRANNKTLIGEKTPVVINVSVPGPNVESPVIRIQAEPTAIPDVAAPVQAEATATPNVAAPVQTELPAVPAVTGVSQVASQPPAEAPAAAQGSWAPVLSQEEMMKRKPTPSMMNDYYAASPRIFPHICSLCNVECRHLKDWIKHQNSSSHIESCRNLRQQYPDWNPQVLSSVSNEGKNNETSKKSKSRSVSPRRGGRSGSGHTSQKSGSRSPRSSGRRSRSRSPRRSRLSPRRSPLRSRSPKRFKKSSLGDSPDKSAVDAAVKSFIEASKRLANYGKKPLPKPSNPNVKGKKQANNPPPKKWGGPPPKSGSSMSSSSSSSKKPDNGNNGANKPGSNNTARTPTPNSSASKKTNNGSSNYKKPVVSTAAKKTTSNPSTGKKPQSGARPPSPHRKTSGLPPGIYKEIVHPMNKFTNKKTSGRFVHVTNLPDTGYTDEDLLKILQPFGKVSDILIVRSKNEAFMETYFCEAAAAAVKFSETTPIMVNNQRVTLSLSGQGKKPMNVADKGVKPKETPKAPVQTAVQKKEDSNKPQQDSSKPILAVQKKEDSNKPQQGKSKPNLAIQKKAGSNKPQQDKSKTDLAVQKKEDSDKPQQEKPKHVLEVPPGFIKCYMLDDPPLKQSEQCVILISNLPKAPYTVDEISNLAKPFGGINDILIIANHRKAYLELLNRNSLDSMIKYYSAFPTYLGGNLLSICIATKYKDLKNEDLIFADIIEQESYKITPTIYEKFVYLTNLPEKDVENHEILCVGLRFGKVEHHVHFSNKNRAILHLNNPIAAKAMYSFLSLYPCSIKDNVLECSLPTKAELAEDEYRSYLEEDIPSPEIESTAPESKDGGAPKMDVDPAESEAEDAAVSDSTSKDAATVMAADEDDGDEEAAEAPEAPEGSPLYVEEAPQTQHHEPQPVYRPHTAEELENLVSVESDEEEAEEQQLFLYGIKCDVLPSSDITVTSADEGPCSDSESEAASVPLPTPERGGKTAEKGSKVRDHKGSKEKGRGDSDKMIRTTKYNARKGDISVTVTLDSQKSSAKSTDYRKKAPWERGTSAHDSGTPRSSSNRSSPANGGPVHNRLGSNFSQKKTAGKYGSTQPERDPKDMSRQRERDDRFSSRKDDRTRGSSSSRYARSSKTNTRSPRSNEEEETFPFNLDEFVTVDEIVEEHVDSKEKAAEPEEKSKKSRVTSTDSHNPSFVTLDEVGDEEENASVQKTLANQKTPSRAKLAEGHAKDGPPARPKEKQMLMTLDEISDDDGAQDSSTGQRYSTPVLTKPSKQGGNKEAAPGVQQDELKADDDMSFADIENQFLTVDEIGEEEEELEIKDDEKTKAAITKDSSKHQTTPAGKQGQPRKRPLPQSAKGNPDSSPQATLDTSKGAAEKRTPAEAAAAKKVKLESPAAQKKKLAPYNPNTTV